MSDAKSQDKITPRLTARLAGCEATEAVIELSAATPPSGLSRTEAIRALREGFEAQAGPVEAAVVKAGGQVLAKAWINRTLLVRLPGEALGEVADLAQVGQLDAPADLEPD